MGSLALISAVAVGRKDGVVRSAAEVGALRYLVGEGNVRPHWVEVEDGRAHWVLKTVKALLVHC